MRNASGAPHDCAVSKFAEPRQRSGQTIGEDLNRRASVRLVSIAGSIAVAVALMAATEANAWVCRATSSTGSSGWASSGNLGYARQRALLECAVRTPRGRVCYIRSCR